MLTINCRFNRDPQAYPSFLPSGSCPVLYFTLTTALSFHNWLICGLLSKQDVNTQFSLTSYLVITSKTGQMSVLYQDFRPIQPANQSFSSTYVHWLYTAKWYACMQLPSPVACLAGLVREELRVLGSMMDTQKRQCGTCSNPASYLCCCLYPLLPLCELCTEKHPVQFPGQHLLAEMHTVPAPFTSSQWVALHRHLTNCKSAEGCVDLSIEEIRECMSAIQHQILPSTPTAAIIVLDELSALIDQLNSDLTQGWTQACELLFTQNWTGCSAYPRWMLNCTHVPKTLFSWRLGERNSNGIGLGYDVSIPEAEFEVIQRETSQEDQPIPPLSQPSQSSLALVSADLLYFFDYTSETWSHSLLKSHGPELEGCLLLINTDSDTYFCTEGTSYNTAISHVCIYTPNGYTMQYIHLQAARAFPGVYLARNSLYLFGGVLTQGEITDSVEHLDSNLFSFQPLLSMLTARRSFTPCENGGNVYLCGGFDTTLCEKYHIPTQKFSQIPLILPEISDILAYWQSDELLIVSRHFIVHWTLSGKFAVKRHVEWSGLAGCSGLFCEGETLYNAALGHINAVCVATSKRKLFVPSSFDR